MSDFSIMEQFDTKLSSVIDSTLGMRCRLYGYRYIEINRSLMSVYFCGGSCIEDVITYLMYHLSLHPTLRTCSADTILRAIKELTQNNISYTSDTGKTYDFNTDNLWSWFCVLPQVAWWGKGHLYVFMVTFDALCPLFTNDADYFRFCIISCA